MTAGSKTPRREPLPWLLRASLALALAACGPQRAAPGADKAVPIRMLRVRNPNLPALSAQQVEIFLAEAQRFAADQLGLALRWVDLGEMDIETFFRRYCPVVFPENRAEDPFVLEIIEPNPVHTNKLAAALAKNHQVDSLDSLREFASAVLPAAGFEGIDTKDAFFKVVAAHHLQKLSVLSRLPAAPGAAKRLLDPALPYHQYVYWDAAAERVRRFDFILTNQALASAESVDASIHSSLRGGVTTGFTERSHATYGGTVVLSTYPVLGEAGPIREMRGGDYAPKDAARYLGAYSSHEFGHLLLHRGHPFDHPACVMNPAKALRYQEWYEEIETAPLKPSCRQPHDTPLTGLFLHGRPWWEQARDKTLRYWDRLRGD